MFLGFNPRPLTYDELMQIVTPEETHTPEVIPAVLYSTRTYPAAGVPDLEFFTGAPGNIQTQNVSNGQLPAPQFAHLQRGFVSILAVPTSTLGAGGAVATGVAGALNNIERLLKVQGGGVFILEISSKRYMQFHIRAMPAIGGGTGIIQLNSSNVAASQPESLQVGHNGIPGLTGLPLNGMIAIPPQTDWLGAIRWAAPLIAVSADTPIAVELYCALYRKVL